jgi:decaprenylphospho-beta-D-ribofuranose 2-oxidase
MELAGWGRYPKARCTVLHPRSEQALRAAVAGISGPVIARGMGRAYGDSALNREATIDMRALNHMLAFDPEGGLLTVEAGVVLGDIIESFLPRGWFPSVTPGTKLVTVGGMIAADVHGKNHHRDGSFGNFVEWIDLLGPDGEVRRCSREENSELFGWTIGGMGLTGIVLRAAFHLRPVETGWIRQKILPAPNLDDAMAAFEEADDRTYSVAWIDCLATGDRLGRSLLLLGEHALVEELDSSKQRQPFRTPRKRKLRVPVNAPAWALNRWSVQAFNTLYYRNGVRSAGEDFIDWDSYFYPLDAILDWNRIYGRRGFVQFQCVLPLKASREGLAELLRATAASGQGSFLAVLKRFGRQESLFSFPMEGYTLALDFPVNRKSLALLQTLDAATLAHGGRFYLAKDARMKAETFAKADPRVADFRSMRDKVQAAARFASLQSERLST